MLPDSTDSEDKTPSPIELELRPAGSPFAAIIALCGEHDLATAPEITQTLTSIHGNVLLDLSRCEFLDSSAIAAVIAGAKTLEREGFSLELLVPPANATISRTLQVSGVDGLLLVHPARPQSEPR
jgi:anti-anti-sigma factor